MLARLTLLCLFLAALPALAQENAAGIDRQALVSRHNPKFTRIDPAAPLMLGNGTLGFTADITGLQTFAEQYSPRVPLMTQAQWSWHSFPNPRNFTLAQAEQPIAVRGGTQNYPYLRTWDEAKQPHIAWLRENPHRFNLGRLGLYLAKKDGTTAAFTDLSDTNQVLDLWRGQLTSVFTFDGEAVVVETSVHPTLDAIVVRLRSPLVPQGRLGVELKFPGVAANTNPNPADWNNPAAHHTTTLSQTGYRLDLERRIDDTHYFVTVAANRELALKSVSSHHFRATTPGQDTVTLLVSFSATRPDATAFQGLENPRADVARWWSNYWTNGGIVSFEGSTDPRAHELERRVVLSQYLMALNGAGRLPPQEEGLFSNSWHGKFHLEMHAWHSAHFAIWGRSALLERSMPWYAQHLEEAKARARAHGVQGAWWPKMVGPEGRESPSTVNPFIMWQQPHPIYLAEVVYIDKPTGETLNKYKDVVFATADLLATWPAASSKRGPLSLGPPIIPAQESHPPQTTFNPTFEIEYFRFGLTTAQAWRERLGLPREASWDAALKRLPKLPQKRGLYLAAESNQDLWEVARSPKCSQGHTAHECMNRDHPSFVAALGLLPGAGVDKKTMRRTLKAVLKDWDLRQTWGWDWPMLAMTATRLGEPELAVRFLLTEQKNFQFGATGMTPRVHIAENGAELVKDAAPGPDGPGYQRVAETYFPSNGSLLLAIALMTAGGSDGTGKNAGFPVEGWQVRSEGIHPVP
jgi:hypothetical protein